MPNLQQTSVEHLAEVFARSQNEIIEEWTARAAELLKDLQLAKTVMTDHMPDVILEITRDLSFQREGPLSAEHRKGSPPVHGVQRFHDGLDLGEVVAEYNLLRDAFYTVAERHQLAVVGEAARIINHRIDEAVRMAVMAYAGQQTLIRKAQQDEHLAFLVHDLRTPMNAISLLVEEIMLEVPDTQTTTRELYDILQRNLRRIEDLIQKVLKANTQTTGTSFLPERRTFELWPLVQRLILDLRAVATRDTITVVNEIPPSQTLFADAGLISQVFQNLLGNAFKYAARGRVVVGCRAETDRVVCFVRDNGAGIPLDMLDHVFDTRATDPDKEGTGLGLAIVKQIVEAHGGAVDVENTPGSGASFSFDIPNEA